ncbi:MAG: hypothetical protein V4605_06195 [Pseudomonadota bacterium]
MKPILTKAVLSKPIVIQLLPSTLLLGLLVAVATISAVIILISTIILPIKYAVFVLIIISTIYYVMRDALLMLPWSWQKIEIDMKGVLNLTNKKQQKTQPQLEFTSFIHQYLTILNFKRQGVRLSLPPVLLLPNRSHDLAYQDALRRLRVWMRFFKHDKVNQDNFVAPTV